MVVYILFVLNPEVNGWEVMSVYGTKEAAEKMASLVKHPTKITIFDVLG